MTVNSFASSNMANGIISYDSVKSCASNVRIGGGVMDGRFDMPQNLATIIVGCKSDVPLALDERDKIMILATAVSAFLYFRPELCEPRLLRKVTGEIATWDINVIV